jgi:hypothetical protein
MILGLKSLEISTSPLARKFLIRLDSVDFLHRMASSSETHCAPIFRAVLLVPPLLAFICFTAYCFGGSWWWTVGKAMFPLSCLCAGLHVVSKPESPTIGKGEKFCLGLVLVASGLFALGSILAIKDAQDALQGALNVLQFFVFGAAVRVVALNRDKIAQHMDAITFLPAVYVPVVLSALPPVFMMATEPFQCLISQYPDEGAALLHCEGVFQPVFAAQFHITAVAIYVLFASPVHRQQFNVDNLVKFRLCALHKLQGGIFFAATVTMFLIYASRREDGVLHTFTAWAIHFEMLCWVIICGVQALVMMVFSAERRKKWTALPEEGHGFMSTRDEFRLAPLYTYGISVVPFLYTLLSVGILVFNIPILNDLQLILYPINVMAITVVFFSRPRETKPYAEYTVYLSLVFHHSLQIVHYYVHGYGDLFGLLMYAVFWTASFPMFCWNRRRLGLLPDDSLKSHVTRVLYAKTLGGAVPVVYLALESIACTGEYEHFKFESLDYIGACTDVISPGFVMSWHIVAMTAAGAIFSPFMSILYEDMIRLNVSFLRHTSVEFLFFASLVSLFAYASKFTGYLVGKLDIFGMLNLLWVGTGVFEVLATFNQKKRKREKGLVASGKLARERNSGSSLEQDEDVNIMDALSGETGPMQIGGLAGFS